MSSRGARAVVPDYVSPVLAWRCWGVVPTPGGARLASIVCSALWTPRQPLAAQCHVLQDDGRDRMTHDPPARSCTCGIYGARAPGLAGVYLDHGPHGRFLHRAIGQVALWDRVLECEHGWRASRAYPTAIYLPDRVSRRQRVDLDRLCAELGAYLVPVSTLATDQRSSIDQEIALLADRCQSAA